MYKSAMQSCPGENGIEQTQQYVFVKCRSCPLCIVSQIEIEPKNDFWKLKRKIKHEIWWGVKENFIYLNDFNLAKIG